MLRNLVKKFKSQSLNEDGEPQNNEVESPCECRDSGTESDDEELTLQLDKRGGEIDTNSERSVGPISFSSATSDYCASQHSLAQEESEEGSSWDSAIVMTVDDAAVRRSLPEVVTPSLLVDGEVQALTLPHTRLIRLVVPPGPAEPAVPCRVSPRKRSRPDEEAESGERPSLNFDKMREKLVRPGDVAKKPGLRAARAKLRNWRSGCSAGDRGRRERDQEPEFAFRPLEPAKTL